MVPEPLKYYNKTTGDYNSMYCCDDARLAPSFYALFASSSLSEWSASGVKASYMPAAAPNKYMVIGETGAM